METNKHCEQKSLLMGIRQALVLFYKYDAKLLSLKANEQCLVGNFYRYFCNAKSIRKLLNQDRELRVDLEYDKCGQDRNQKMRQSIEKGWRPDMVVHHRGDSSNNICLFEFKRHDSPINYKQEDHEKIKEAIAPSGLNYHFGCYIEFGETHETSKVELYTMDSDCHCVKCNDKLVNISIECAGTKPTRTNVDMFASLSRCVLNIGVVVERWGIW